MKLMAGVSSSTVKALAMAVFVGIVLPNIIFLIVVEWLGIGRSYINLDYVFAALFFAFGFRLVGCFLLLLFQLVDVFFLVGQIFPFARVADVVYLLGFVDSVSGRHLLLVLAVCLVVLVNLVLVAWLGWRLSKEMSLLLFNVLLIFYIFHAGGDSGRGADRFYRVTGGELISSQTASFLKSRSSAFFDRYEGGGEALSSSATMSATSIWRSALSSNDLGDRLLLVINESWGEPLDKHIQDSLLKPLRNLELERREQGAIPYVGVTLGGELRELCQLQPNYYNLAKALTGFEACLPNKLRAKGYVTGAMHGAVSIMYDRRYWYPRAGFESTIFFESKLWPRRCYSFPGACDLDLMGEVEAFFSRTGKRFFYWLTLNSHSLYDKRDIKNDIFDCEVFGLSISSESCRNFKLQAQFFQGLSELLKSESMRGVEVVVVGDHTPVIMKLDEKRLVFHDGQVPWIRFKLK